MSHLDTEIHLLREQLIEMQRIVRSQLSKCRTALLSFDTDLAREVLYNEKRVNALELKIDRASDGARLFEGKAQAVSTSNRLQYLVPNLVEAMFTDFPGDSGQTVRISIAPEKQPVKRNN